jgi:hypothetical protein
MEAMNMWDDAFIDDCIDFEDAMLLADISLEAAGLEEDTRFQPGHGFQSVPEYVQWFSDNEDSRYESN